MKRWSWVSLAVGALLLAGCEQEAKKFGYKGLDLEDADQMFFSTGPTTTNWVPTRVLSVCESYELTAGERKLVADAGIISPGEELPAIPEGYSKQDDEPWFATWTKPHTAFGLEGVVGFLSHYDEDRKVWSTSEGYFSSYWPTEAEAVVALGKLKATISQGYDVKKFYDFDKCWVAEYVRLRVMAVVGQKADGRWSCMLDVQDKNRPGCGAWEPIPDQQERRDHYVYTKAMRAWRSAVTQVLNANHAAVQKSLSEAGLPGLQGAVEWQMIERPSDNQPCLVGVLNGTFTNALDEVWSERLAQLKADLALAPAGEPAEQQMEDGTCLRTALLQDARYDVRLDAALPAMPPADAASASEDASVRPSGQWRILCFERVQPGVVLPKRPELAK